MEISCHKLGIILEKKVSQKLQCALKLIIICSFWLLCNTSIDKIHYFDFWPKFNLIFYPFLENFIIHIAIVFNQSFIVPCDLTKYLKRTKRPIYAVQVNVFQKHLFLHQLTHNMTKVCSLIYFFLTWKLQAQNKLCT